LRFVKYDKGFKCPVVNLIKVIKIHSKMGLSQQDLDWYTSARKYYQSFRILSFLGYTKQALNALCTSIEKFLKHIIMLDKGITEKETKNNYRHDLKKLFKDSNVNSDDFKIINSLCNQLDYNNIRYEFEATTNSIVLHHKELDDEMMKISKHVICLINKKYGVTIGYFESDGIPRQYRKYKKYFLKRAFKSYDRTGRIDFT